ncbi:hypothetical protein AAFC00_000161 [Neodothiora populina]
MVPILPTEASLSYSLPGRDAIADADTSLIRKRQRLTPSQPDSDGSTSAEIPQSPLIVEIVTPGDHRPDPPAMIMIMDDKEMNANPLESYPFIFNGESPTEAAGRLADHCNDMTKIVPVAQVEKFMVWVQDYVTTSPAMYTLETYTRDRAFWMQIGRCFDGLSRRSSNLAQRNETLRLPNFYGLSAVLAKLTAVTCAVEADELEEHVSRKVSAEAASPERYTLLFRPYITAFERFMASTDPTRNLHDAGSLITIYRSTASMFIKQQKSTNALFRICSVIAVHADAVQSSYSALLVYLNLSLQLLSAPFRLEGRVHSSAHDGSFADQYDDYDTNRALLASLLQLLTSEVLPIMLKTHPDCMPLGFHGSLLDMMIAMSELLQQDYARIESGTRTEHYNSESDLKLRYTFTPMHSSIRRVPRHVTSLVYKLDLSYRFIKSSIMSLRVLGLDSISALLFDLQRLPMIEPDGSDKISVLKTAADYLRSVDMLAYLFGPESHADLIRRSFRVIEFMAATQNLMEFDANVLWNACLQNQWTDMGQASHRVVCDLLRVASLPLMLFFCRKFEQLSPPQIGKPMLIFYRDMVEIMPVVELDNETRYELACISVHLLQKVSAEWKDADIHSLQLMIARIVLTLLEHCHVSEASRQLLEVCALPIRQRTSYSTGSVHMALNLLASLSQSDRGTWLSSILTFREVTIELSHYVKSQKCCTQDVETIKFSLFSRIKLASLLLSLGYEERDLTLEKDLWENIIGSGAIDNPARNIAWDALFSGMPPSAHSVDNVWSLVSLHLPCLDAAFATPAMLRALRCTTKKEFEEGTYVFALREHIVRFYLTVASEDDANQFKLTIIDILFDKQANNPPRATVPIQVAVAEQCLHWLCSPVNGGSIRAVVLLRQLLVHSIGTESKKPTKDSNSTMEGDEDLDQMLQIPVRLYGIDEDMVQRTIVINKRGPVTALRSALIAVMGSDDFIVITGGKLVNFDNDPSKTIMDCQVDTQPLIVKRTNALQSIEQRRAERKGRTAVEQAILSRFDRLFDCLLDSSAISEQVFWLLTALQHTVRRPSNLIAESRWRSLFSIHCLRSELQDQLSAGIADASFILDGVHLLIDAQEANRNSRDALLLCFISEALFSFLRERPVEDLLDCYFPDPSTFVETSLYMLCHIASMMEDSDDSEVVTESIKAVIYLYQSLLESVRLSPDVCSAFIRSMNVMSPHRRLLLSKYTTISRQIAQCVRNFCRDNSTVKEAREFFWSMSLTCIRAAQDKPVLCASLYELACDMLATVNDTISSEDSLRDFIANMGDQLLRLDHKEHFGCDQQDERVLGLCTLLLASIERLKSFSKPLKLSHIATRVFQKFLFPDSLYSSDQKHINSPIVTMHTRQKLYKLVCSACEDSWEWKALASLAMDALRLCDTAENFQFPENEYYNRSGCGYSGLVNLQQTCYMNSLIQQLFMNIKFRKFILDLRVSDMRSQAVLYELQYAFASLQDSFRMAFCPDKLARALDVDFTVQDDAQIFFTIMIGKLEESMPNKAAQISLKNFFAGLNKAQTVGECGHVSESYDSYFNLSLTVKDKASLEESLQEYVQGAPLEGGDKFKCVTCNSNSGGIYVNAMRRTGLEKVPDNLVLGLKRFRYETFDGGTKVNDMFDFPERIDLSPYMTSKLAEPDLPMAPDEFQLVGVVVHDGTLQYGHYWSYAAERYRPDGSPMLWFKFEDHSVTRVTSDFVVTETRGGLVSSSEDGQMWLRSDNAYVLYYERLSSIATSVVDLSNAVDPSSFMCPRVAVPEDIGLHIAVENEKHLRTANMFSSEHAEFIQNLLTKGEHSAKALRTADREMDQSMIRMALEHLHRVTLRTQSLERFDTIFSSLRRLAMSRPANTEYFLQTFLRRPLHEGCERFIFHKKKMVRLSIAQLLVESLRFLRTHDLRRYGQNTNGELSEATNTCVQLVMRAHSILLDRLHFSHTRIGWAEYFDTAIEIASLGLAETILVFEKNYLLWSLEILHLRLSPELQSKHAAIWHQMQNNRVYPLPVLAQTVCSLLNSQVDLRQITVTTPKPLIDDEAELIRNTGKTGCNLLTIRVLDASGDIEEHLGPARLVSLLTDCTRVDKSLIEGVCRSLQQGLGREGSYGSYVDVIRYCIARGRMPHDHLCALVKAVAHLADTFEDAAETILIFMKRVYPGQALPVLQTCYIWANKLLACDDTDTERATLQWMGAHIFSSDPITSPLTEQGLKLDHVHVMAIKSLAATLMHTVQEGHDRNGEYANFENAIDALKKCADWLVRFNEAVEAKLSHDVGSHETPSDQALENIIVDLQEASSDAFAVLEQCQNVWVWLMDWSHGGNGIAADEYRPRRIIRDLDETYYVDEEEEEEEGEEEEDEGANSSSEVESDLEENARNVADGSPEIN